MAIIVKPNTFSAGATIIASEHNDNFDTIFNDYNGNITNANIVVGAGIIDTKLAQITTASKVSGTALTGLASINTSIAGTIPLASIPAINLAGSGTGGVTGTLAVGNGGTGETASPLPVAKGGTGATAAANAANGVVVLNASSQLPAVSGALLTNIAPGAGTITTTMLKTATGEVSVAYTGGNLTLPGGEYGFYPQVKAPSYPLNAQIAVNLSGGYVTNIYLVSTISGTIYAQQRYVTASGEDLWIFLLLDKITKEIIATYQAPDAPHYGNGGDFDKMPHPFPDYDETKHEIVLLDKETCLALKAESKQTGKSILTLVNEGYKPNMDKEEKYEPLHSGKFLTEDNKQIKQMVNTIPNYIKVRKLIKK